MKNLTILLSAFFLLHLTSFDVTNTWIGSISNDWETAENWSLGNIPTIFDDVVIPEASTVSMATFMSI